MGNLACDVLFRLPAREVIHYSRSPALTNMMHGQVPERIPKLLWLTLLSICIHPNGWDHLLLTEHWPSGRDWANCTWIMHVDTRWAILNSVLYMWHMLVFFLLKYQPRREKVVENETITSARENEISWCIVCLFLLLYVPCQQLWSLRDGQFT